MKCGSPGYVAPEILNDLGYDCKADIFSAGVILYILYALLIWHIFLDWLENLCFLDGITAKFFRKTKKVMYPILHNIGANEAWKWRTSWHAY
jgi:serine/threonine protein kinase